MIETIHQNTLFVVINKPPGVSFHSEDGTPGLFERVKLQFGLTELYPVHRLDKVTSGLVIFAKSQSVAAQFGELFEKHLVEKYYLAISQSKPKKKQGWIKGDMVKARRGAYKLLRSQDNPAITQFISVALPNVGRLFLVKPHSGKTHQIRVALKGIGSPILGDTLYGGVDCDRAYLHAYSLRFTIGTEDYCFICPPNSGEHFSKKQVNEKVTVTLAEHWQEPWLLFKGNTK